MAKDGGQCAIHIVMERYNRGPYKGVAHNLSIGLEHIYPPRRDLSDLEYVEFYLPNFEKSRRMRNTYEFPLGSRDKNL